MIRLAQPRYLGAPRSQLGVTGQVIASIVQAAAAVTMATIQLIYQEYAERRARKQWERDQRSKAAELEKQNAELVRQNQELSDYLTTVEGGTSASTGEAGVSSFLGSPYLPYVVIGGGVIAVLLLTRRKT